MRYILAVLLVFAAALPIAAQDRDASAASFLISVAPAGLEPVGTFEAVGVLTSRVRYISRQGSRVSLLSVGDLSLHCLEEWAAQCAEIEVGAKVMASGTVMFIDGVPVARQVVEIRHSR